MTGTVPFVCPFCAWDSYPMSYIECQECPECVENDVE